MKQKICHFAPPAEIYDVIEKALQVGIQLPKSIEQWYQAEITYDAMDQIKDLKSEIKEILNK